MGRPKLTEGQRTVAFKRKRQRETEWTRAKRKTDPARYLWYSAKKRAKERGLPFDIKRDDIQIPDVCPYLGIPLISTAKRGSKRTNIASVDRIDNSKGYIKGNIEVVSHLANTMKSNATPEQLRAFARRVLELPLP